MADSFLEFDQFGLFNRRRAMQWAGGTLGLNLGSLWRAQSYASPSIALPRTGHNSPIKSCIIVFYYGGPSHLDTYDLKPDAPAEVRGEFQPIATSAPGIFVSEHLPKMSRVMHKVALIRSMHHKNRLHDSASTEALTGRPSPQGDREEFAPINQFFPCFGATLSYLWQQQHIEIPHAALPFVFHNVIDTPCQGGGFLGTKFDPLQISLDLETNGYRAGALTLPSGHTASSVSDRRRLLETLELAATSKALTPVGHQWRMFCDKAFQLLGSEALRHALELTRESQETRDRYGYGTAPVSVGEGGGGGNGSEMGYGRQMRGQNLLCARRLVEAGVPFVNVYDFRQQGQNWDAHFKNFNQHKTHLMPLADQSLSTLIDDLDERGLLDSTLVVAMGEFGRTPKINQDGGRDHWPDCYSVLLAGGGVTGGAVYGSSDRMGAFPATEPTTPADLAATIFWRFGLDPATELHDLTGRPHKIADGQPIKSLFA
ncbi:DUF1501 domain-containing protein [Schlesneria paludicola]|uniref:DUF1501 domain-containing protein n=1 Tax=Schlesneria paludicola TaxID=360056 RepID=UPI00029A676C|nr:DUF1501 domain-containing protein [Schlesneria paludicola]